MTHHNIWAVGLTFAIVSASSGVTSANCSCVQLFVHQLDQKVNTQVNGSGLPKL